MGDTPDNLPCWEDYKREKKLSNRESSLAILRSRGIDHEVKNDGIHLIVRYGSTTADFWPSTGKWIERGGRNGRGVFSLIRRINQERDTTHD